MVHWLILQYRLPRAARAARLFLGGLRPLLARGTHTRTAAQRGHGGRGQQECRRGEGTVISRVRAAGRGQREKEKTIDKRLEDSKQAAPNALAFSNHGADENYSPTTPSHFEGVRGGSGWTVFAEAHQVPN